MYKKALFLLVVFALYLPGCGSSSGNGGGPGGGEEQQFNQFSVNSPVYPNDTAFLFPVSENRPQPFVSLASEPEIPGQGNFQRIIDAAVREGVFFGGTLADPNNWAMVGWRYTPCEFFVGEENPCREHVRFIYQPMDVSGNNEGMLDFSLHVVYEYQANEVATPSELMAAMYQLREAADGKTDGLPLGVHPVLQDRIDRAVYFNRMRRNIWEPFVFDRPPTLITFMGLAATGDPQNPVDLGDWRFIFGTTEAFGRWTQQQLPDGSGRFMERLFVDQTGTSETNPNFGDLFSNINEPTQFNILTGGRVNESTAAAVLLPHVTNDHNVNCAGCHVVDSQIIRNTNSRLSGVRNGNFSMDQFSAEISGILEDFDGGANFNNYLVSNEFKGGLFTEAAGSPSFGGLAPEERVVTRMFGYKNTEPVISQRMAFDNGMAVNEFNKAIRMADRATELTTNSCSGFEPALRVMVCLFGGDLNTSLDQCIAQSCQ
jgi:hypothetical protein